MYDVWGPYSTNIFAVGVGGVLIHREIDDLTGEATWIKVPQQDNEITIRGFWGADEENMWMVGRQGTILHFDGQFMTPEPTESIATLYDVIGFAGGYLVAVGDLGTILRRTPSATE
jgi:hypothetical protein